MESLDKYHFKVKYKFLTEEEGGRKTIPYQGYRSDLTYKEEDGMYIIHPRFEDVDGNLIPMGEPVRESGIARMIILNSDFIPYHKKMNYIGKKCFMVEGKRITAECEIIEL